MNQTSPASTSTNAIPVMIRIAMNNPSIGPANVDPFSGSHQCMVQPPSFSSLRCEREVLCLRLAPGHRHGRGGGLVSRRQAGLHVHEDVRERAVRVHHHHFLGGRRLILRLALRLLSHVDLRVRRLGPGELDVAGDRRAALRGLARPRREAHDPHTYCNRCYGTELAHRSSCMRIPNPTPPPPRAPPPPHPRAPPPARP